MKFCYVGLGAGGNKGVMQLITNGVVDHKDVILINSTDKDIPDDFKGSKIILRPDNTGCGKERSIAKEYAVRTLKTGIIDTTIPQDATNVILVTSVEGGTGSGATPVIAQYISEVLARNVHIICFTGFEEDVRGLQNTVEFFQEISSFDVDVQVIKLSAFLNVAKGNKFTAEELADEELCRRINIMIGTDLQKSVQNIDDTDILKVVSTLGYKTIEELYFDTNLMDQEQFNKLCKQMIYNSKSLPTSDPGMVRLGVILNIRPESEDAVDYTFSVIKNAYGIPYESFFHKQWDGKEQYIRFICSGMKLPIDEVEAIHDRYIEASKAVDKKRDDFFSKASKLQIEKEDSMFDMGRSRKTSIDAGNFFKNFETTTEE